MLDVLEQTAATLADTKAGWVTRRDAAELLGAAAARAVEALLRHADDSDVDVRSAVQNELTKAKSAVQGATNAAHSYSLDDLACGLGKEGERTVTVGEQGYVVDMRLRTGRHQRVYLASHTIRKGAPLIRVMTLCGHPVDTTFEWALQANMMLTYGAIALVDVDGAQQMAIVRYFPAAEITPTELRRTVREIAYYGDWIESKLSGKDEL